MQKIGEGFALFLFRGGWGGVRVRTKVRDRVRVRVRVRRPDHTRQDKTIQYKTRQDKVRVSTTQGKARPDLPCKKLARASRFFYLGVVGGVVRVRGRVFI